MTSVAWKTIELEKGGSTYELEIDAEDPENLTIENVTHIDGPKPEEDIDPILFEEDLDIDDWQQIREALKDQGVIFK